MSFSDAELIALAESGVTAAQLVEAIIAGRDDRRLRRRQRAGQQEVALTAGKQFVERPLSASAMRMRRMRARRAEASHVTSPVTLDDRASNVSKTAQQPAITSLSAVRRARAGLVAASHGVTDVTIVTVGRKKENPPHPLKKKPTPSSPKKGVSPQASRKVTTGAVEQIWLDSHDARFRELGAMRGKPYPTDREGGWRFEPFLVAKAEERLKAQVAVLMPSSIAMAAATGPPAASQAG